MKITGFERKIAQFIKDNCICMAFFAVSLIGVAIRATCFPFESCDAWKFLIPWYEEIQAKGIHGLSEQVGDYNILYQFFIYLFTLLPIKPLYSYKIFSVIFDYFLAYVVAVLVDDNTEKGFFKRVQSQKFVIAYTAVLSCPLIFLNSSCWAQCDSIYAFFIFACLFAYLNKKYTLMFILYGIAFSFKFQAIFALPLLVILYFIEVNFSVFNFLIIPITLILSALPGIIMGRSVLDPLKIYFRQMKNNNGVWMNCHTFWNIVVYSWPGANGDYKEFKVVAFLFTMVILGIVALLWIQKMTKPNKTSLIELLHLIVYTCVLFLPGMHDRYGYIYEITAIMLVFISKKYLMPAIGVIMLSSILYGWFLFGVEYNYVVTSAINTAIYGWYVYLIMFKDKENVSE